MLFSTFFVKYGIAGVEILRVELILRYAESLSESLVMNDLAFTEESDRISYIGIVSEPEDVVVGCAGFLLCCNLITTTISEAPVNFYRNISCAGDSFAYVDLIDEDINDLP